MKIIAGILVAIFLAVLIVCGLCGWVCDEFNNRSK
jgi:hypothetical protein